MICRVLRVRPRQFVAVGQICVNRAYFGGYPKKTSTSSSSSSSNSKPSPPTSSAFASAPPASGSVGPSTVLQTPDGAEPTKTVGNPPTSKGISPTSQWSGEFDDTPLDEGEENGENWTRSFKGLGSEPFSREVSDILLAEIKPDEVEITPDGLLYLPEIRYRRILNRAFGPGGWGLAPRSKTLVTDRSVSREYALICHGRLIGIARGEQDYFDPNGITTAMEGCKSNAMMRCCKDLGIASELWDPLFIRQFKAKYCEQKYFEKKRRMVWKRKDREWEYPYK